MRVDKDKFEEFALEKGDRITRAQVAALTGVGTRHEHFPLAVLAVKQAVERRLDQDKRTASVRTCRGEILILSDSAAVAHNRSLNKSARRKANKAAKQIAAVDVSNLSVVEREEHQAVLQRCLNDRRALRDARDPYSLLNLAKEGQTD
jgi:hypothetical protein